MTDEEHKNAEAEGDSGYRFFNRGDVFWAGLVFFASYFFYLISLYPTVTSEDSGEFAAAAHSLGVAHPPGYPLFVILAKLFTVLVPFGDIAWRVNAFSAFFGAAAVALIYLLVRVLTKDPAVGLITALVFAGGEIYWSQAIRAEVYTLNTFFLVLVMLQAVMWRFRLLKSGQHQKSTFEVGATSKVETAPRLLKALAFIYGLSLGNHQLMLLAGPPLLIFILISKPRIFLDFKLIAKLLGWLAQGLSVYLFLPLAASYKPEVNWGNPVTWDAFWTHVERRVYSAEGITAAGQLIETQAASQSAQSSGIPAFFTSLTEFLRLNFLEFFRRYLVILDGNYSWVLAVLSVFGATFLWIRDKAVFWLFITLVIFNSVIMSAVTGVGITDKLPSLYFTDRPFFIPLLMLTCVLGGLSIRYIASLYYERGKRTAPASKRSKAIFFIAIIPIIILAFKYSSQNQSGNYIAHDIAKKTMDMLPQDAVLISENGDNTVFPILYLQTVKNYRTDVKVYITMPFSVYRYFRNLDSVEKENPNSRIFTDFPFGANPGREYFHMGPVAEIVPEGSAPRLTAPQLTAPQLTAPQPSSASSPPAPSDIRGFNAENLDFFHLYMKARYYMDSGLAKADDPSEQKADFEKAFNTAPLSRNITGQLIGNYLVRRGDFAEAIPYLQAAREYMPNEYPINFQLALSLIISGKTAEADSLINALEAGQKALLLKEMGIYGDIYGIEQPAVNAYLKGKQ